jgi:hypothetical protein
MGPHPANGIFDTYREKNSHEDYACKVKAYQNIVHVPVPSFPQLLASGGPSIVNDRSAYWLQTPSLFINYACTIPWQILVTKYIAHAISKSMLSPTYIVHKLSNKPTIPNTVPVTAAMTAAPDENESLSDFSPSRDDVNFCLTREKAVVMELAISVAMYESISIEQDDGGTDGVNAGCENPR